MGDQAANGRALQERCGWRYLSFPESAICSDLPGVVHTLEQAVRRLGGLAQGG